MPYYIRLLIIIGAIATILIYFGWLIARADAQNAICAKRADLTAFDQVCRAIRPGIRQRHSGNLRRL
jgi:hypothetical protein